MKTESEIMDNIRELIYELGLSVTKKEEMEMFEQIGLNCDLEAEILQDELEEED